jgi:hypothetical protein
VKETQLIDLQVNKQQLKQIHSLVPQAGEFGSSHPQLTLGAAGCIFPTSQQGADSDWLQADITKSSSVRDLFLFTTAQVSHDEQGEPMYTIQELVDKRYYVDQWQYLVRWLSYETPTWEPAEHLKQVFPALVEHYEQQAALNGHNQQQQNDITELEQQQQHTTDQSSAAKRQRRVDEHNDLSSTVEPIQELQQQPPTKKRGRDRHHAATTWTT